MCQLGDVTVCCLLTHDSSETQSSSDVRLSSVVLSVQKVLQAKLHLSVFENSLILVEMIKWVWKLLQSGMAKCFPTTETYKIIFCPEPFTECYCGWISEAFPGSWLELLWNFSQIRPSPGTGLILTCSVICCWTWTKYTTRYDKTALHWTQRFTTSKRRSRHGTCESCSQSAHRVVSTGRHTDWQVDAMPNLLHLVDDVSV